MAQYRSLSPSQTIRLPQQPHDEPPVEFPFTSKNPAVYRVPIPPPAKIPPSLDTPALTHQIEWCDTIRGHRRDISPRYLQFVLRHKKGCEKLLNSKMTQQERIDKCEEVRISGDFLSSRYEEVNGPKGLVAVLLHSLEAMTELRIMLQYGDYLALSLEDLKSSTFSGAIWKGTEWLSVAKSLENENTLRNQLRIGLVKDPEPYVPLDDTPFSNEVSKAAKILGKTTKQVVFEIEAYAARNQACHNDVINLIHKCHWSKLAELLSSDLLALKSLFKLDVARQSAWRETIHALSQKYFEYLYRDGETPMFVLTDFANKKTKKQIVKLAKGPEAGASTPTTTGNDSDL